MSDPFVRDNALTAPFIQSVVMDAKKFTYLMVCPPKRSPVVMLDWK